MRLIDAAALIALINKRLKNSVIIGWLCSIIGEVPTIEARPVVRGEWVLTDERCAEMSCSVCGFTYYGEWDKECMSNFCPECGADMRGEDDG